MAKECLESGSKARLSSLAQLIETHIRTLFCRLDMMCGHSIIDTSYGTVKLNRNGVIQIDGDIWDRITQALNKLNQMEENSFESLMESFQLALFHHYSDDKTPLYNPAVMRDFAEEHAPGMYEMIFNAITRTNGILSKERQELQHQRTVVILHTLAYYRSQKTSILQKDLGFFLNQHGASRSAINSGPILGYSTAPRTVDRYNQNLWKSYPSILNEKIEKSKKEHYFIMLLIDDFHNIHTVRLPETNLKLSSSTHMVSSLLDIHPTINAIKLPFDNNNIHCCPTVNVNGQERTCVGGIDKENVKYIMKKGLDMWKLTFMDTLPEEYHHLSGQGLKKHLTEFSVYGGLAHKELATLETCILVDEFEQNLKSTENYKEAIDHIFTCSGQLPQYLKEHVIPFPGDWPSWYYTKKLIATTHNSSEVYPYESKFKLCKDTEYTCIIHILDEILPLVFFQYGVVFRSGNLQEYQNIMFRFLIAFILWDRHHYDRSTLSMLNDLHFQKVHFPEYYNFKTKWFSLLTEKKS